MTKGGTRPLVGVLCCNEFAERPVQVVASRFVLPLTRYADATVLLVPAMTEAADVRSLAGHLDGLLLTGSRSHVAPRRYGSAATLDSLDEERDEIALALSACMIEAEKPIFGICRGLQEINVLFGGSLAAAASSIRHHRGDPADYESLFDHVHDVDLAPGGRLASASGQQRLTVNSVHQQVIERLGAGLAIEAVDAEDSVIEAVAARPCGADVLAVQWHPEWNVETCSGSRAFFRLVGESLRGGHAEARLSEHQDVLL